MSTRPNWLLKAASKLIILYSFVFPALGISYALDTILIFPFWAMLATAPESTEMASNLASTVVVGKIVLAILSIYSGLSLFFRHKPGECLAIALGIIILFSKGANSPENQSLLLLSLALPETILLFVPLAIVKIASLFGALILIVEITLLKREKGVMS